MQSIEPVPFAYPTDNTHALFIDTYSGISTASLAVTIRQLLPSGRIETSVIIASVTSDFARSRNIAPVSVGYLLSISVTNATGSGTAGDTFVRVSLGKRSGLEQPELVMMQGYVGRQSALAWPPSQTTANVSADGLIRLITGTDPAAGLEADYTTNAVEELEILAISFVLSTSATVASRTTNIVFTDSLGGLPIAHTTNLLTQAASVIQDYTFTNTGLASAQISATRMACNLPPSIIAASQAIETLTQNLQVGDDFSALFILARQRIRA